MLLTVGDSFTTKRYPNDIPWPEVLSKKLNLELVNISCEGVGNDYIFKNFVEAVNTKPITKVVIQLSSWDRLEIGVKVKNNKDDMSNPYELSQYAKIMKPHMFKEYPEEIAEFFSHFYKAEYFYKHTICLISAIQDICKAKNVDYGIMQLLKPLFFNYRESNKSYEFSVKGMRVLQQYIQSCELLPKIDQSKIIFKKLTPDRICSLCKEGFNFQDTIPNGLLLGYHNEDIFIANHKYSDYRCFDLHPNIEGHEWLAKNIYEYFNSS
tara:strand:- start:1621 stop:2418 length:798 start_codon:yes stop_codon:yes gene_type:complete